MAHPRHTDRTLRTCTLPGCPPRTQSPIQNLGLPCKTGMGKPWSGGFGTWLQDTKTTWSARNSESPAPLSKGTRVGVAQAKPHDPTLVSAKIEESCQGETQQSRLSKTGPNPTIPAYMRTQHRHTPRERIRHRVQKESSRSLPRNPCSCETHHIVARGYATTQQGDRTKHSTALLPFALSARQLRATPYTCFHCDIVAVIRDDFHSVSGYCVAMRLVSLRFFLTRFLDSFLFPTVWCT